MSRISRKPIVEMPQPLGLFAGDLLFRSKEYFSGFDALGEAGGVELLHARYFLLFHAFELLLKAHLAAQGTTKKQIFDFGHRLEALYAAVVKAGAEDVKEVRWLIINLNDMNSGHDFRYPTGYRLSVPAPHLAKAAYLSLSVQLEPAINSVALKTLITFHADYRGQTVRWSD